MLLQYYGIESEFGIDEGKFYIIRCVLYGVYIIGVSFSQFLAGSFSDLCFKLPSCIDPDMWVCPKTRSDGEYYYNGFLVYVDDILFFAYNHG